MQFEVQHYDFLNNAGTHTKVVDKKSKLDECIYSIVKKEGYISCDISKKTIAADGGNYLAILYEVDVKGKTIDGDKESAIFVKSMAIDATIDIISLPSVYKTELFVYNDMTKIFNDLQNEGNVPVDERYNMVKCYEESTDEAIIMENLTKKGFKTWHRMDIVTLSMAEECVKQLAKLHGLSFVTEQRRPDYFNTKIKTIKTPFNFEKTWNEYIVKFGKIGIECLSADLRNKVEEKVPGVLEKMEEYFKDECIKYCLCHGDYRPNNLMSKEVNGKVTEVIPVDYQLIHYGCPMFDFLYFIYVSTDRQFRRSHMTYLKNLYYQSLDQFLQYFDMSAESVLPRKTFENLYEDKLDYGLIISFLICPFLFVSEDEDVPDVTREHIIDIEFKFNDRFKDRLTDAVEEFIEMGYL